MEYIQVYITSIKGLNGAEEDKKRGGDRRVDMPK